MEDQVTTINAVCGNCMAWTVRPPQGPVEIGAPKIGLCRMFPPTPAPVYDGRGRVSQQINLRPTTAEGDACLHFVVKQELIPPGAANDAG